MNHMWEPNRTQNPFVNAGFYDPIRDRTWATDSSGHPFKHGPFETHTCTGSYTETTVRTTIGFRILWTILKPHVGKNIPRHIDRQWATCGPFAAQDQVVNDKQDEKPIVRLWTICEPKDYPGRANCMNGLKG